MPIRKSKYGKKKTIRRKRTHIVKQPNQNMIYSYKRTCLAPFSSTYQFTGTGGGAGYGHSFQLSDISSYAEFTALYDEFRINKVVCRFYTLGIDTFTNTNTTGPTSVPYVHFVVDEDDATALTSISSSQEYQNVKCRKSTKPFSVTIYPRVANTIYLTAITSAYSKGKSSQWVDLATPTVPHYGLKSYIDAYTIPNGICGWFVELEYHIQFRGVR